MNLKIGDKAPDFTLYDQDNISHSLNEYQGNWLLLYFYPKDNTSGCTQEACMLRDDFEGFKKLNVEVVGVSVDSAASHKKFADEYKLPFTLLADDDKKVVVLYGVWKNMGTVRTSFLINPKGIIEKIYENVNPAEHSKEVLQDLKEVIK